MDRDSVTSNTATHERSSPSRAATIAAIVVMAAATVAWRLLTFAGFNNDHYIYLAGAQQMLLGDWPVRDFVDPGWPLMNALPALARLVFGKALIVEVLLVAAAFALGAACTVAAVSRLSGSLLVAIGAASLEILINPRSFGYPKIALYAVAVCAFVWFSRRPTNRRVAGLAALTVAAFLFRHDHGLYIGIGALVAVIASRWHDGWRQASAVAARLAALVMAMLAPWAVFVQYHLGLTAYFRPALAFSRSEAEATLLRTLPQLDAGQALLARENAGVLLFYLFHAVPVVCIAVAVRRAVARRQRWTGEAGAVIAVAVMALAMNLGFLRSPLLARVPDAVVPAVVLLSWLLAWTGTRGTRPRARRVGLAAVTFGVVAWAVGSAADVSGDMNRAGILGRAGAFDKRVADLSARLRKSQPEGDQIPSRTSTALQPFFGFVQRCTAPGDRIVMTGLSPDVFVLADRGFAGGQMAFRPNFYRDPADQRRAIARMRRQSVPFFILALEEEADFRGALQLLAAHLDERYSPLVDVPIPDQRGLRIYVERRRGATGTDRTTGWPCFSRGGSGS